MSLRKASPETRRRRQPQPRMPSSSLFRLGGQGRCRRIVFNVLLIGIWKKCDLTFEKLACLNRKCRRLNVTNHSGGAAQFHAGGLDVAAYQTVNDCGINENIAIDFSGFGGDQRAVF